VVCCWIIAAPLLTHAAVVHEWNFNETSGTTLFDSVGSAHAQIISLPGGGEYQLDGKRVRLDGGARASADYVLFPENTFDGLTNVTVELWVAPHSFPNWGRVFDIGPGEGGDNNLNLVRVAMSQGTNGDLQRQGLFGLPAVDTSVLTPVDREFHYVMTWSANAGPGGNGLLSFYRDGVLLGSQDTGSQSIQDLAALPNTTFWLGRSHIAADSTANASYNRVRVYDAVLDPAVILANFRRGADDTFGMLHRWTFSESGGTNLSDVIGTATGSVVVLSNVDHSFGSGQLTLTGGARASADYVAFPARRLDGLTNMTIEVWATPNAAGNWTRVFDMGDGTTPGTSFFLSFTRGTDLNYQRLEFLPSGTADSEQPTTGGLQYHYVVVWDQEAGRCDWYRDGQFMTGFDLNGQVLANVGDTAFWLGRSHYGADQTAAATYNDVRVYNRALHPEEILFRYQQGPDSTAVPPPVAQDDSMTLNPGAMALIPVLDNDLGTQLDSTSITIAAPPASGTAQPTPEGRILYTHNGGPALPDQFTYTVNDVFGATSSVATVSLTISPNLRLANTTITVPDTAPPVGYQVVDAFPGLFFEDALAIRTPPGRTNQIFVAERRGIISYVPDIHAATPVRQVLLDISDRVRFDNSSQGEMGLLSFDFHPGFETNGQFFVFYMTPPSGSPFFERVSRFTADPVNLTVNTNTEQVLFSVIDQVFNHNGGDIHFGPEGYLYISMGDEGDQYNFRQNAQRIDRDFYSGILRIDVDKRPGNVEPNFHTGIGTNGLGQAAYSIPVDNPWVHISLGGEWDGTFNGQPVTNLALVRGEFWAVGFRHPWRMGFDTLTGELWAGDVGQDWYEEVDLVVKGGNYGWAHYEGTTLSTDLYTQPNITLPPPGFEHIAPVYEYIHAGRGGDPSYSGDSVTGGVVYRGSLHPELYGAYLFADFEFQNIWVLRRDGTNVMVERIATDLGIASFGLDPSNGDVLIANYFQNSIKRLVRTDLPSANFPQKLSETGIFADLATLAPNPGIVSYEPRIAFWSDYAIKRRWFVIPDLTDTVDFGVDQNWGLPAGMKWIKHFDLESERGNSNSPRRRLETRVLVKTEDGNYGVSYKWNEEQTEAFLVADGGEQFEVPVTVGGMLTNQLWEIPSRAGCAACHSAAGGHALSFNTRQINHSFSMNGVVGNQIDTLGQAGYFSGPVPSGQTLPVLARAEDSEASLEFRVRSYLAVNCIQCHSPGGAAPGTWDARPYLTLEQTHLIGGDLINNGGDAQNKVIVPGDPAHSVLLQRIQASGGFSRMPPLGTHELDEGAINLLNAWITGELTNYMTFAQWQVAHFGSTNNPLAMAGADPDSDGANNYFEYLTKTDPQNGLAVWKPGVSADAGQVTLSYPQVPNLGVVVETTTNLFNWWHWDVPGNQPFFGSQSGTMLLQGPLLDEQFFRARLTEP
jgi:glucose/arabinose dehydrogenase